MTFSNETLELIVFLLECKGRLLFNLLMASFTCLHSSMQEEYILEHADGKCQLCTLWSACRPLCNISIHLVTLLKVLMAIYQSVHLNTECHEVTLMLKLWIVSLT